VPEISQFPVPLESPEVIPEEVFLRVDNDGDLGSVAGGWVHARK
jgi:hypothetical protein